jgi:hypothetical protein
MFTIQAAGALAGVSANANTVTYTIDGMELSSTTGTEVYKILAQGNLAAAAANLYTAPANNTSFIKRIFLANQGGTLQSGVILYLSATGAAPAVGTQITGNFSIPVNGCVIYDESGWTTYDANMQALVTGPASGRLKSTSVINPGTTTYTVPAGVNAILVECIGAGGGGGGANANATNNSAYAGGGGAGGYARKLITSLAASYTVAAGNGGAGGNAAGSNGAGGSANTTFAIPAGVTVTASLGAGGVGQTGGATILAAAGGAGGAAANGDINITGGNGANGGRYTTVITTGVPTGRSGAGGNSVPYGPGAPAGLDGLTAVGQAATLYGGGGAGGAANGSAAANGVGGSGANGSIFVWEFA